MDGLEQNKTFRSDDGALTTPVGVRHPISLKRILAPTDLTPDGRKAVVYAMALAEVFGAQLTLLHVYERPNAEDDAQTPDDCSIADLMRQNAQTDLDLYWSQIKQEYPRTDTDLRFGVRRKKIVAAARDLDVDLVVISTHNYHWLTHLIRGSDAEHVLRHAPCPIMVVRKEERDFVLLESADLTRRERSN